MQITTRAEYVWSSKQDRYILLRKVSRPDNGRIAFCKGASAQQTDLGNSQQSFYQSLTSDYAQQFGSQNAILSTLQNSLNPIIAAGPNQFGFSTGETNTLNSQAIQGTGQQYSNASGALKAAQAAQGGGNSLLPSGVASQQQAGLASAGANQASNELLGIQQAGYTQGHQQYENAVSQEEGVAGLYNPNGLLGGVNSAGSAAGGTLNEINQENNAASPWGLIGGALGGIAGSFVGMPGLGASLGGSIGGGVSNELGGNQSPYGANSD